LEQALDTAARQNPGVSAARLRVLEREQAAVGLRAAYLPQAELAVSAGYRTQNFQGIGLSFPGIPSRVGPFRTFDARPVVTQKILDFSLVSKIRAARLETAAAKFDVEAVREETQAAVISLYLQAFQAQSRLRAAKARLASADALLTQVTEREKGGAASQLDVARNRQQREAEQVAAIGAEQELATVRPALDELLGGAVAGELVEPVLKSDFGAAMRADVRALEERIRAAEQELQRAKRMKWPVLTGSGDYGLAGAGPDRSLSTYNVGATLAVPLWTSGRIAAEMKAAGYRVEELRAEKTKLELAIAREAAQSAIVYEARTKAAGAARQSAEAAAKVVELARLRYEGGLATSVDTVTAQAALAEAEETAIRAKYDAAMALARLAWAKGDVRAAVR
jgi:outer membrane protein TolC